MEISENLYMHAFNLLPQIGAKRLMLLANFFESFDVAYKSTQKGLKEAGLPPEVVKIFLQHRETLNLYKENKMLTQENIQLLNFREPLYPKLLLETPALPPLLYIKGDMRNAEELMLAVVGTRKITNYGRTAVPLILEPLVKTGLTIVSGLAFGVDAAAHMVAVQQGARTIAILGCGLDEKSLYPKEHQYLASQILENGGALISEHPPGRPALKQNFVARNRIISGMSVATLVIECGLKSGALITARHALDQNRQVYAIPGPIYSPESQGPNNLLKMGAKCVSSAEDILNDLNIQPETMSVANDKSGDTTPEEQKLLDLIGFEPISIDEIIKQTQFEAGVVGACLTLLEIKGRVKNLGAQQYILARKL